MPLTFLDGIEFFFFNQLGIIHYERAKCKTSHRKGRTDGIQI
jgi:hypothetical protein